MEPKSQTKRNFECGGYSPGHPWYYKLGGKPLSPKQIWANAKASDYHGYKRDEIAAIDRKAEPARSSELRKWREKFAADLRADLNRYREVVRALHRLRDGDESATKQAFCSDVHVSVSLKHNHLYNDFAHLILLDDLLSRQRDLFDL